MRATEASKRAAVLRLALTPPMSVPGFLAAMIFLGAGSPVGLILAVAPFWLLWIWCADVVSLLKKEFRARPLYYWLVASSVVPSVAFWVWNRLS